MRIGLAALGIGSGARPDVVAATAASAERAGFATLWHGEHVVLVEPQTSRYPYAADGVFGVDARTDWLDPFAGLAFAAAHTKRIRLATGICLVPEHNPLILAKQVASLDHLSDGRMALGVGIGWSAEEFAALGVPFERRAARTREYVAAMRALWRDDPAAFSGELVRFAGVHSFPKPIRRTVPILVGGESSSALARAAAWGDGWYGFDLGPDEAAAKITELQTLLAARGRDAASFEIVVAPFTKAVTPDDRARYADLGVTELVLVASPPDEAAQVGEWVSALAHDWIVSKRPT